MVITTDYTIDVEYTLATLNYSPMTIPYMQVNEKNIEEFIRIVQTSKKTMRVIDFAIDNIPCITRVFVKKNGNALNFTRSEFSNNDTRLNNGIISNKFGKTNIGVQCDTFHETHYNLFPKYSIFRQESNLLLSIPYPLYKCTSSSPNANIESLWGWQVERCEVHEKLRKVGFNIDNIEISNDNFMEQIRDSFLQKDRITFSYS